MNSNNAYRIDEVINNHIASNRNTHPDINLHKQNMLPFIRGYGIRRQLCQTWQKIQTRQLIQRQERITRERIIAEQSTWNNRGSLPMFFLCKNQNRCLQSPDNPKYQIDTSRSYRGAERTTRKGKQKKK